MFSTYLSRGLFSFVYKWPYCFLSMFLCLPTSGNIVAETKFASQETKMFPNKFRNVFVAETMFTGFPACFQMFPTRETLFSQLDTLKQCLKL